MRRLLRQYRGACFAHGINLAEVFQRLARARGIAEADRAIALLERTSIVFREDLDRAFWRDVGEITAIVRGAGHPVALGDCCGMALARRLGGEFVTAEHNEMDPILPLGLCRVRFIR